MRYAGLMNSTLTIKIPKKEKERLSRLALRYGFSLPEFSRYILEELSSEIPIESFEDYEQPEKLKASLRRAMQDYRAGRVHTRL